jgi:hypothetical protein
MKKKLTKKERELILIYGGITLAIAGIKKVALWTKKSYNEIEETTTRSPRF